MPNGVVIVGVGSNIGALHNLRRAISLLRLLPSIVIEKVSRIYESDALTAEDSPTEWNLPFLNLAVRLRIENFEPSLFLKALKIIETEMGRDQSASRWSPRLIDLDILFVQGLRMTSPALTLPHDALFERPFAYLPAVDVYPEIRAVEPPWYDAYRFGGVAPFNTRVSEHHFLPRFIGILNVTPDSFSDGGEILEKERFLNHAQKLVWQGAEYLELGAESTRPGAFTVDADEEFRRLNSPLEWLKELKKGGLQFKISLDSRNYETAERVSQLYDVDVLNDVSGLGDVRFLELVRGTDRRLVVMHSVSVPPRRDEMIATGLDPVMFLCDWWRTQTRIVEKAGVKPEQIIFDPGLGFGKNGPQNKFILENLERFAEIKNDIMIGHSRKSFLNYDQEKPAAGRDLETALATQKMNSAYAQFVRVHDVASQKIALRTQHGL